MSGTVVAVISSTRSLKSAYRTCYHSRSCRCTSTNISSWYKRQDKRNPGIWPTPEIWDNIIILQLRTIKLICQPLKQAAWVLYLFFSWSCSHNCTISIISSILRVSMNTQAPLFPQELLQLKSSVSTSHSQCQNCCVLLTFLWLSEIRTISLVGLNQTVGHNYVVFPSISPSKLSLLRRVSWATSLSCAPMCACVRVCLNVKIHNPRIYVTGVCVIFKWVWHTRDFSKMKGGWGLIQPIILMGADVLLLWHSSIIMVQWTHSLLQHHHHSLRAAPSAECGEIKCT